MDTENSLHDSVMYLINPAHIIKRNFFIISFNIYPFIYAQLW